MKVDTKKISAEIVADSMSPQGKRIVTFLLTYPRMIHGEVLTHRVFSRNSASSRAIPFEKMVKMVEEDPFIPIAWQKNHKGMQGTEYLDSKLPSAIGEWIRARSQAVRFAKELNNSHEVTKQLCNRLLEPFMWHTALVTTTELDNWFDLRAPYYELGGIRYYSWKDVCKVYPEMESYNFYLRDLHNKSQAEIHIQALAEAMWDKMNESTPKRLYPGQWHLPFSDKIDFIELARKSDVPQDFYDTECSPDDAEPNSFYYDWLEKYVLKVCTARAARLSYATHDGEIDYKKDIRLHDQLLESKHFSCFEHVARCMSDTEYYSFVKGQYPTIATERGITNFEHTPVFYNEDDLAVNPGNNDIYGWCNNFRGWIQYRYLIENGEKI